LVQPGTNLTQTTRTDSGGRFTFPAVAPGNYNLTISASGFRKTTINGLVVEVTKTTTADETLEVGSASEVVEVTAPTMTQLQTTDSSVGEVLSGTELNRMPVLGRSAAQLIFLQPAVVPDSPAGLMPSNADNSGGQIAGSRSEQITFTIDGGDATSDLEGSNSYNSPDREALSVSPVVPIPQDSVEEFRVTTNNANSSLGRASGGQVNLITKSGTNAIHGALYEYHDDDGLDANGWTNDFLGIAKPSTVDNRFGAALGGPIIKDKLFYYGFYEGRRFHDVTIIDRTVPTATLKAGELNFGGVLYNFNPKNGPLATGCGAGACDPRGIGASPVVLAQLALYPTGNNATLGDGLNSTGFTADYPTPVSTNVGKLKLNYVLNSKWSAFATWQYSETARTGTEQVDILGTPHSVSGDPYWANFYTVQVEGQITPNFLMVTHGSFLKNWWGWSRQTPAPLVSGTSEALTFSGEGLGSTTSTSNPIANPININTQQARARVWDGHDWYMAEDMTWVHRSHNFQFGGAGYIWDDYHLRTDDVLGGLTSAPVLYLGADDNPSNSFVHIDPSLYEPASVAGSSVAATWDGLYTSLLGIVDHSAQIQTRNGKFQPSPLGTPLFDNVRIPSFYTYFQDTWKATHNLTITYGVNWGVQLAPSEAAGKEVVFTYSDSGNPIDFQQYLQTRRTMLGQGLPYNPSFSLTPVDSLPTPLTGKMRNTYWGDIGPRIAAAWEVPWENKLFGNHQTVLRGGYALSYDRSSAVGEALNPLLTGGLADVDACNAPTFAGGLACTGAPTSPATAFRIGVDGSSVPIPAPTALPIPSTPAAPFGQFLTSGLDPYATPAHSHQVDFTVQRALPRGMFFEIGYIGRFGRNLAQSEDPQAPYYLMKDPKSGQTLAQAFDALYKQVSTGAAITPQPFFENQMGGVANCGAIAPNCTQALVAFAGSSIGIGDLDSTMRFGADLIAPTSLDNNQFVEGVVTTDRGYSDYNAGFVSFRKAMTHGLQFQADYTWSHAIGNQGINQQYLFSDSSPYNLALSKGSEAFDHRNVFHFSWYYELPFGKGKWLGTSSSALDRVIGGWHTSGIFQYYTGAPFCVFEDGNYGSFFVSDCAIPTAPLPSMTPHYNVTSSGGAAGVATTGNLANGGAGINAFADPVAVYNSLVRPQLSVNNRIPFDQLRGFPLWNLDFSLGKNIAVTERFKLVLSADFFNVFNHTVLSVPNLDLGNPGAFGVIGSQANNARQTQLGLRVEF
jgi:carboxypeptidase family protein